MPRVGDASDWEQGRVMLNNRPLGVSLTRPLAETLVTSNTVLPSCYRLVVWQPVQRLTVLYLCLVGHKTIEAHPVQITYSWLEYWVDKPVQFTMCSVDNNNNRWKMDWEAWKNYRLRCQFISTLNKINRFNQLEANNR